MRERIFLVPRTGIIVRDPATNQCLPPEGMEIERSSYWIRRIKDGDVSIITVAKTRSKLKREG